jgi:hypothetical protein
LADVTLLLRFHVADPNVAIKTALNSWTQYREIAQSWGLSCEGALTLSTFALLGDWTVDKILGPGEGREVRCVTLGRLQEAGVVVWPTNTYDAEGHPDPRNDVHYDLLVPEVEGVVPDRVAHGTPAQRRAARQLLLPNFEAILALMEQPAPSLVQ